MRKNNPSTAKPRKPASSPAKRQRSRWLSFVSGLLLIMTVIAAVGLIVASFGGNFEPDRYRGICLMVMVLPAWLIAMVILTVLDVFWCRKALIVSAFTFIACASAIWDYSPLNLIKPSMKKYADVPCFTFLTYNVAAFKDLTGEYRGDVNPTISNILRINADVVCLQEAETLFVSPNIHITPEQIDSLHKAYPYMLLSATYQVLLSKYPAETIHTDTTSKSGHQTGVYRVNIEGTPVTIFNVHLASYQLTGDDKSLYKDVTKLKDGDEGLRTLFFDVKSQLLAKVQLAAEHRQAQADRLCRYLEHYGGPNVIIAGDFNDVPGCYTLRRLAEFKMKQAYSQVGFGPMITFNRDRFLFRIDHVLYRGDLKPLRMKRGSSLASDHYPLLVTFAIPDKGK